MIRDAKKCMFQRGTKYPEKAMSSYGKSSTSTMFAVSASGELLLTYVVYKAEYMWDTWTNGGRSSTDTIGASLGGLMQPSSKTGSGVLLCHLTPEGWY